MTSLSDLLVMFAVSGSTLALPADAVSEFVPEPALLRPPGMPSVLAGLFRLRGRVVPAVRTERLLDLPPPRPGPFRALVVLRSSEGPWALLVERVMAVVSAGELAPAPAGLSFYDCVMALHSTAEGAVPVLSPYRLMRRRESLALASFADRAAQRWEEFAVGHL